MLNLRFAAFAALLLLPALAAAAAARAECSLPAGPAITLEAAAAAVTEDRSQPIAVLTAMRNIRQAGDAPAAYDHVLGVTENRIAAEVALRTLGALQPGGYCLGLQSAVVTLRWTAVVHLAAEIDPGSCIESAVRKHEREHVDLAQLLLALAGQKIRDALAEATAQPVVDATPEAAGRTLQQRAQAAVDRALVDFDTIARQRQDALDTPEAYDRVPKVCGDAALQALLQKR